MLERRDTGEPMHVQSCTYLQIRALIRLVAAETIREWRLFRSALAQVRLLFKSGVYSRVASIRSYTVHTITKAKGAWLFQLTCSAQQDWQLLHVILLNPVLSIVKGGVP